MFSVVNPRVLAGGEFEGKTSIHMINTQYSNGYYPTYSYTIGYYMHDVYPLACSTT